MIEIAIIFISMAFLVGAIVGWSLCAKYNFRFMREVVEMNSKVVMENSRLTEILTGAIKNE